MPFNLHFWWLSKYRYEANIGLSYIFLSITPLQNFFPLPNYAKLEGDTLYAMLRSRIWRPSVFEKRVQNERIRVTKSGSLDRRQSSAAAPYERGYATRRGRND